MPDLLGRIFEDGEVIVRQGEPGANMFVVQRGRVEVVRESPNGEDVLLALLGPGDVFGEMAIFERRPRSATARAVGETTVLTVDRRAFLRRVQEDPSLAFNILKAMSERIRQLDGELAVLRSCLDDRIESLSEATP